MATILVVDDSAVVRLTVSRRLRAGGHAVVECASATEAATLPVTGIDGAILDFDLGDGHGVDVASRLAGIRLAFFTSEQDPRPDALLLGPVFRKPDELEAAIAWVTSLS